MEEIKQQLIDMDYYIKDKLYQFEVESKGYLSDVIIEFPNQQRYNVSFYTIERFKQDLSEEMLKDDFFYEENIIFLENITLENLLRTISVFNERKIYMRLIPRLE